MTAGSEPLAPCRPRSARARRGVLLTGCLLLLILFPALRLVHRIYFDRGDRKIYVAERSM